MPDINDHFNELEARIGLSPGFSTRLLRDEDDWSFVIKLHALFEAVCTHLVIYHLQEPAIARIVARMELSNKSTGKIAMLSAVGLLGSAQRRFLTALSELRNDLVHDVRNCDFHFAKWVAGLDAQGLRAFAVSFSPQDSLIRELRGPLRPPENDPRLKAASVEAVVLRARNSPRFHVWVGAFSVLSYLWDMEGYSDYLRSERAPIPSSITDHGSDDGDEPAEG